MASAAVASAAEGPVRSGLYLNFMKYAFCKNDIDVLQPYIDIVLFRSSQQHPSSWSQYLELLFELTQHPSRALILALCVCSGTTEIQGQ